MLAVLFILIILFSLFYAFSGKYWLEDQQNLQKYKNREFLENDLMEKILTIQYQTQDIINEILDKDYLIELFPRRDIKLIKEWSIPLPSKLVCPPVIDHRSLIFATGNEVMVLNKCNLTLSWRKSFSSEIKFIELSEANRLLVLTGDGTVNNISRDNGDINWQENNKFQISQSMKKNLSRIVPNKLNRLDSSIIMLVMDNEIRLINNITGDSLSSYQTHNPINQISDFDVYEKCVYVNEGLEIIKLIFKIED
ncbi:MAG: hypothetical protein JXB60_08565 [Candidatus Cloacimonetes bacterium]|nr:hypothetical protein [Candidatus Cloacimonadota bacterium]